MIEGIEEVRDETDREGIRIVLDLKRNEIAQVILNKLYKHTQMETNFGIIFLAIENGMPKLFSFKEILLRFLDFRKEIVLNRTRFELNQAEEKCHLLEGLKIALENIDLVLKIIRSSDTAESARKKLIEKLQLSEKQSQAILDMRLQKLTKLEKDKLIRDFEELQKEIRRLNEILSDDKKVKDIIKNELIQIREKYADERRTDVIDEVSEINLEDLIVEENMVVTITHRGYIKRTPLSIYRTQKRGGKGKLGISINDDDFVEHLFISSTHSYFLIFTNIGKVYWMKVHQIPEAGRTAKGKPIVNLLPLQRGESVTTILPVRAFEEGKFLAMATRRGWIKKTELMAYSHPRSNGIVAIHLEGGDELLSTHLTTGEDRIFLATRNGKSILVKEDQVRPMQRAARGVKAMTLREGDSLVAMDTLKEGGTILTITEKGYGKRTETVQYRIQNRGGIGLTNIKISEKNGNVVNAIQVFEKDNIVIMTNLGKLIRIKASEIKIVGRNAMGVKLIDLSESEKVVAAQKIADDDTPA